MGIFSKQNKPPIERILDEAMPMVIGLHHASCTAEFTVQMDMDAARAAIARYVETDGALLDTEALEVQCDLAALMTGTVAAIAPSILCMDLKPVPEGTQLAIRAFYKEGMLSRRNGERAIDAFRRGILAED